MSLTFAKRRELLEPNLFRARHKCLREGYDISIYDESLNVDQTLLQTLAGSSRDPEHSYLFDIEPNTNSLPKFIPPDWTTTNDRITNWLLDNLQSSEMLAYVHRQILNMPELDDQNGLD